MRLFFILLFIINLSYAKDYYKIGFSQDTLQNDWRAAQVEGVKGEVLKYPELKLEIKNADSKLAKQISDIEYFINNDFDFIITSPINAKITAKVLKKAIDKDIKVILIDRGVSGKDYTTFIAPDNYKIAKKAGEFMAKSLNCSGTVLMLEGIEGATPTILRTKGFMDAVKECKDIRIIKRRANFLRSDAITVMEEIYTQGIKFDAIYSHSDSMLAGVRVAHERYKKDNDFLSVGIDYISDAKKAIFRGAQTASFTYETCAKEGVESIIDIIKGKKVPKDQIVDSVMVTRDNVLSVEAVF